MQASWRQRWRHHVICPVPPFSSRMRKATNFKFGRYIHTVHPSKSLLKICEKRERGRIQGRAKFLQYPLLSQERMKLRSSNLAGIFTASIRAKAVKNLREKGALAYSGTSQNLKVFPIISWTRKATNFKFGRYTERDHANKRPLNLEVKGAWAYPGAAKMWEQSHWVGLVETVDYMIVRSVCINWSHFLPKLKCILHVQNNYVSVQHSRQVLLNHFQSSMQIALRFASY